VIRAYVTDDNWGMGVGIAIVLHLGEDGRSPAKVLRLHENGAHEWEAVPEAVRVDATLKLEDDAARALLDGLMRHYHGAEDTRALRKDYDAERGRVDKLTATLGDVVKALVSEP
jgi:hypothetical protein